MDTTNEPTSAQLLSRLSKKRNLKLEILRVVDNSSVYRGIDKKEKDHTVKKDTQMSHKMTTEVRLHQPAELKDE